MWRQHHQGPINYMIRLAESLRQQLSVWRMRVRVSTILNRSVVDLRYLFLPALTHRIRSLREGLLFFVECNSRPANSRLQDFDCRDARTAIRLFKC